MVSLDLSGVVSNVVPVGDYEVVLTGCKLRENRDKSGEHMMFEMTIQDDDATDENGNSLNGRKLFTNCSFKEAALWKLKETMIAFDADPEIFAAPIPDIEEEVKSLVGNKAVASVVENTSGAGQPTQVAKVKGLSF